MLVYCDIRQRSLKSRGKQWRDSGDHRGIRWKGASPLSVCSVIYKKYLIRTDVRSLVPFVRYFRMLFQQEVFQPRKRGRTMSRFLSPDLLFVLDVCGDRGSDGIKRNHWRYFAPCNVTLLS